MDKLEDSTMAKVFVYLFFEKHEILSLILSITCTRLMFWFTFTLPVPIPLINQYILKNKNEFFLKKNT